MKVGGVICEYNPFHNGHKYHLNKMRESGITHIVCAMSGNFVQRGDCAIADKWVRAKAAVLCGADLVVEIPTPWACSAAESFARGGVAILSSLNIDCLSFGCETDDVNLLVAAAAAVDSPLITAELKKLTSSGKGYPEALQTAVGKIFGDDIGNVLVSPNNTLAVEYIRQRERLAASFELLPIRRIASGHGDIAPADGQFSSASALRILERAESISPYIPTEIYAELFERERDCLFPCKTDNADKVILAALRDMELREIKRCVPDENGLAERIFAKSRNAQTVNQLLGDVKTKNITNSAVRRAVMLSYLKIPAAIAEGTPPYIKVLAANKAGFEIIREREPALPVITKKSEADKLNDEAKSLYALECKCTDRFSMFSKKISGCSREQTTPITVI